MLPIPFFNPFLAPEALHKIGGVVGSELFVLCVCVCVWCLVVGVLCIPVVVLMNDERRAKKTKKCWSIWMNSQQTRESSN